MNKIFKKTWNFIFKSNSILSWVVNIVLAYILIKFVIYPGAGLVLNTTHPIVTIVSDSMQHDIDTNLCGNTPLENNLTGSFDNYWDVCGSWYENNNITKEQFSTFQNKNGLNKGDVMFIYGRNKRNLEIGEVIVFLTVAKNEPIIHRIVKIDEDSQGLIFQTKGDHNTQSDTAIDMNIREHAVIGKAILRLPLLGWPRVWLEELIGLVREVL